MNITFKKSQLVAIVGKVGSGKSTFIQAILGETLCHNGTIDIDGRISYCAQIAWLQNMTIRDNILFGSQYNAIRYKRVISACCLEPDLNDLIDGDATEIGEKGVNISGGQKQRIALARSIYRNDDIYIFDDILSAVDAHVGKHIFDNVLSKNGLLNKKTRIFVTNVMSYLPKVDYIIVIGNNGRVTFKGNNGDLERKKCEFSDYFENLQKEKILNVFYEEEIECDSEKLFDIHSKSPNSRKSFKHTSSVRGDSEIKQMESNAFETENDGKATVLINKEIIKEGNIEMYVYMNYFKEIGLIRIFLTLFVFIVSNCFLIGSSIYLQKWTSNKNSRDDYIYTKMGWYASMIAGQALFLGIYVYFIGVLFVKGAHGLHFKMLQAILRSPVSFFNFTPIGRIINRFTKDMTTVDVLMPIQLKRFILTLFGAFVSFIILIYSNYWILIIMIPLLLIYYMIQILYIRTSRQLKRIESNSRSPIFSQFAETLSGVLTIRAFKIQKRFIDELFECINKNNVFYYAYNLLNRWLSIRLDLIGNCLLFLTCIFAVYFQLNSALCGLIITYCLTISGSMRWMVRMKSDLESNSVSIERIIEYINLKGESNFSNVNQGVDIRGWPHKGKIIFNNYTMCYRSDLPLALNNISITINPNEKIGIVGRTGSGKTTLAMSLFRIDKPTSGSIIIDGVDINEIDLHKLRYSISLIPQDPVVFALSIRENLDPHFISTDEEIWESLEHCHLKEYVKSLALGLKYNCGGNGSNFSVGQRQLLCLGRALLRKSKIIVLDEATASIDPVTDTLIQKTIQENFKNCTIITIAHRINTILDYDRILVMDSGRVVEYDTVKNLRYKKGIFFNLLEDANLN